MSAAATDGGGNSGGGGRRWLRRGVSLALLAGALAVLDWQRLLAAAAGADARHLAEAAGWCLLTLLLLTLRWYAMARPFVPAGLLWHAGHFWTAGLASLLTPAAVGSDLYRIAMLRRSAGGAAVLVGLIARERLLGLLGYGLFFLACHGMLATPPATLDAAALAAWLGVVALGTGLAGARILGRRAGALLTGTRLARLQPTVEALADGLGRTGPAGFALSLGLTLAGCATWAAAARAVFAALHLPLGWFESGTVAVLAELARWLPVSAQGIGVRESVFAFGTDLFGADPTVGFAAGALLYLIHSLILIATGLCGTLTTGRAR